MGVLDAARTSPQLLGPTVMAFLDAEANDLRMEARPVEEEGREGEDEEESEEGEGEGEGEGKG